MSQCNKSFVECCNVINPLGNVRNTILCMIFMKGYDTHHNMTNTLKNLDRIPPRMSQCDITMDVCHIVTFIKVCFEPYNEIIFRGHSILHSNKTFEEHHKYE